MPDDIVRTLEGGGAGGSRADISLHYELDWISIDEYVIAITGRLGEEAAEDFKELVLDGTIPEDKQRLIDFLKLGKDIVAKECLKLLEK